MKAATPDFSYSRSQERLDSPQHDGGDGLERRPPAGTARRRRAAGRTPRSEWRRPGGNLSLRRDPYLGVADTVCRRCLRSVKADGKERPATLWSWCRVPPARTRMIGSSAQPARKEMGGTYAGLAPRHPPWFRTPARAGRRPAQCSRWGLQAVPAIAPSAIRHLICWGGRAETGAIPAIGVFAAAALRAAVPAGGRRSKPSPPWRHRLYALSGPSARSASGRGCFSRQPAEARCPPSTRRHVDQCPRSTRNRHPRQQVAPPWSALRTVSMRNPGYRQDRPAFRVAARQSVAAAEAKVHTQGAVLVPREDPGDASARVLNDDDGLIGVRQV